MHRPPEREHLDHRPVRQGLGQLTGSRGPAPRSDGQLGERLVHRQDGTEPANDVDRRRESNRFEQVSLHPPCQCLAPCGRGLDRGGHSRIVAPIPDDPRPVIVRSTFSSCATTGAAATPRSSSRFGGRSFTRWVITSGSATRGRARWVGESGGHIRSQRSARAGLRHFAAIGGPRSTRSCRYAIAGLATAVRADTS